MENRSDVLRAEADALRRKHTSYLSVKAEVMLAVAMLEIAAVLAEKPRDEPMPL